MKFLIHKILLGVSLACSLTGMMRAENYADERECCRSSCWSSCYECGCNPLYCGAFDLQVQGGVAPIIWTDRGDVSFVQCAGVAGANAIVPLFEIPRFFKLFHVPWTVGGQVGYALDDNIRVYLEFNYLQASGKHNADVETIAVVPNTIVFDMHKYKLFDGYLGARYYWDRWCDRYTFFVGAKVGVTHHKSTKHSSTITPPVPAVVLVSDLGFFNKSTVVSGGLNIGFDVCFCGNWSLVITGEVVASCGPKGNSIAFGQPFSCNSTQVVPVPGVENLLIGHIGTELRFPITAGVRYSF